MIFENTVKIDTGSCFTGAVDGSLLSVYYTKNGCSHKAEISVAGGIPLPVLMGKISSAKQTAVANGLLLRLSGGEVSIGQ